MKKTHWIALAVLFALIWPHSVLSALDPNEIIARADKIRVPEGSYEMEITLTNYVGEKVDGVSEYRVFVKNLDNSLVEFRAPRTERGKSLLMLEDDFWIYLPKLRKPVRVPPKQRLLGKVSIGDMVRTNFAHDYDASLIGEEDFKGEAAFVLDLKAKTKKKTYSRIKYWVAKKDYRPLYAEYFTASGKALKTLTFKEYKLVEGTKRPMVGEFQDSVQKNKKTLLRFDSLTRKRLKDMMFTKQFMRTLE
ncbi:MAG: outer membrane lipoprotein-sorting protein [bacterium]|nr:outer membrane lipoprotein-sorting protein [bacterium]